MIPLRQSNRAAPEYEDRLREAIGHYEAGRLSETAAICEEVLALCPAESDALNLLGAVAIAAGDLVRAADLLGKSLEIQPGDAQARSNLGSVLERRGDLRGAADNYRRATLLRPDYAEAQINLGGVLGKLGRHRDAARHLREGVRLNDLYRPAVREMLSLSLLMSRRPALLSDFTSSIHGKDLGRTMLIACFPKSGSTLLQECLLAATGYKMLNLYYDGHQNEQEIHLPYIIDNVGANSVAHLHCRATTSNINIIQSFQIDTVVLVRDIFDSLVSMADYIGEGAGNIAFFPDDFSGWDRADQLDAMVAKFAHWYIEFFASWDAAARRGGIERGRLVRTSYEDFTADKMGAIRNILAHFGLGEFTGNVAAAVARLEDGHVNTRFNVGRTGRGREELSGAQIERIRSLARFYPDVDFSSIGL